MSLTEITYNIFFILCGRLSLYYTFFLKYKKQFFDPHKRDIITSFTIYLTIDKQLSKIQKN